MKLLHRLFGGRLAPIWEVAPGAIIWKIEVTRTGILVGEARDLDAKRMSLFAVDLSSGTVLFSGRELEETWWSALDSVIGEHAVVHRYPRPDMPNVLGASLIDVATGEVMWSDGTLRIVCGTEQILLAQRGAINEQAGLVFVDASNGIVLSEADELQAAVFNQTCDDSARWVDWISTEELEEDNPRNTSIEALTAGELEDRRGRIEVADFNGFTVVSAYVRSRHSADAMLQGQLDNILLVIDGDRIVYREAIATRLPAPTGDSFFIRSGVLYFVRDGRTLVAIDLRRG